MKYLEGTLKLKVNREKSRTVSVFAVRNFKYLGFCLGKGKNGVLIRTHQKSMKKFKYKLRGPTSRSRCGSIVITMKRLKMAACGWLNYYGIADMKSNIEDMIGWHNVEIQRADEGVDRIVLEDNEIWEDGNYIIYANAAYPDTSSEIGKLMHDFRCRNAKICFTKHLAMVFVNLRRRKEGEQK